MRVLFIGGTGIISSACAELALQRGIELYLLTRRQSFRPFPAGARLLLGDIRSLESAREALGKLSFDAVVDWVAYTPTHIQVDLELFRTRTAQYIFISSASVYQKPPRSLPVTESTPLENPFWVYAQEKIASEALLMELHRTGEFPVTIVRPSHTYDRTLLPFHGGYTMLGRMRQGRKVVVHGDGTSLWTLTHHADFATGFFHLLGNPAALGEAFHITSNELLSWNQIYEFVGRAGGAEPQLVHIPSRVIAAYDPVWGASLLGDKSHSMLFDNSKIRRLAPDFQPRIPFSQGVREIIAWYDADPDRQVVNPVFDAILDRLIAAQEIMTAGSSSNASHGND